MIGGPDLLSYPHLFKQIQKKAERVKNLRFLGFQPLDVTEKHFDRCKVFINTSIYEGFPNTFLQSWSRGIPVISYVDPDNVIKKYNLVIAVNSENELHRSLLNLLCSSSWDSAPILDYFRKNHSSEVINNYCFIFDNLLK